MNVAVNPILQSGAIGFTKMLTWMIFIAKVMAQFCYILTLKLKILVIAILIRGFVHYTEVISLFEA